MCEIQSRVARVQCRVWLSLRNCRNNLRPGGQRFSAGIFLLMCSMCVDSCSPQWAELHSVLVNATSLPPMEEFVVLVAKTAGASNTPPGAGSG